MSVGARRLLRSPLLRLAALGGLLVAGHAAVQRIPAPAPRAPERPPIVVSAERARALETGFSTRWGRAPSAAERAALIEQTVQDEILYREARLLALGLADASVRRRLVEMMRMVGDKPGRSADELVRDAVALGLDDDVIIRRLLAEKMRLVLKQDRAATPIRDADLATLLERDREHFLRPETVTVQQLFLSTDTRGDDVSGLAVNIAARIMSHAAAGETLVSETTRLATLGSGHRFEAVRTTDLKGIPEEWRLYRRLP